MKQKEVILFKSQVNRISTNSKYTFRAIVRYAIIAVIASLVSVTLFTIKGSVNNFQSAEKMGVHLSVVVLLVLIGQLTIKMNQYYFNGSIFNLVMVLMMFGYATFMTIFLHGTTLDENKDIYKMFYFAWPILAILIIWYIGLFIFERKTRPFISGFMLWKTFNAILLMIFMWVAYLFVYKHTSIIKNNSSSIDLHDKGQFMHIVAMGGIAVTMAILWLVRYKAFSKRIKNEEMLKNVSIGVAVIVIIPITIWFLSSYFGHPAVTHDWIILIAPTLAVLVATSFTFFKKLRVSSPTVLSVIFSIAIMIIWLNKFMAEYAFKDINSEWEKSITLIALSIITILIFIKNNPNSTAQALSQLLFAVFVSIFILAQWFLDNMRASGDNLDDVLKGKLGISFDEMLNTFVLTSALSLVTTSIFAWYKVQATINHNLSRKLRKQRKVAKQEIKGGKNA